jgi:hypothetical protein
MVHANKDRALHQQGRMFRVPEHLTRYCEAAAGEERRTPGAMLRVLVELGVEARERMKAAADRAIAPGGV